MDSLTQNSETGQQIFELLRNIYIWSWLGVWVGVEQVWDLEVFQGHPSYPEQVRTLGTSQSLELNRPNGGVNGSLRWLDHSRWVFPDAHNIKTNCSSRWLNHFGSLKAAWVHYPGVIWISNERLKHSPTQAPEHAQVSFWLAMTSSKTLQIHLQVANVPL